eukprot:1260235-Amorphochlora_amoeboformis.AAC.1
MSVTLMVPLLLAALARAESDFYRYKHMDRSGGVDMGTHMRLAVPPQLLFLLFVVLVGGIGFLAYKLLNIDAG